MEQRPSNLIEIEFNPVTRDITQILSEFIGFREAEINSLLARKDNISLALSQNLEPSTNLTNYTAGGREAVWNSLAGALDELIAFADKQDNPLYARILELPSVSDNKVVNPHFDSPATPEGTISIRSLRKKHFVANHAN